MNDAVTHGPLAAGGGGSVQPGATSHGIGCTVIGCFATFTLGIVAAGVAMPVCEQVTDAF